MKLPLPITHLPHPHSRRWGWVIAACYIASAVFMAALIAALFYCVR